jgi:BirA family biotin operon repressor/biotin-[acetyl-CoA-carboxylase] ligase
MRTEATHRDWFGLEIFRPGPRFVRAGASCYLLEDVPSTSDFLLGRGRAATGRLCRWDGWGWQARPLAPLSPVAAPVMGTLVVARRQTAGRGRQGRRWQDCGGLHMSCVVPRQRADFTQGFSVWLGLMVVLALREAFGLNARLKWPNDILVAGNKLGGLIVDNVHYGRSANVVAGLGINLTTRRAEFPPQLQGRATSVWLETGRSVRPGEVAGAVLARVGAELNRFGSEGWAAFASERERYDALRGCEVAFRDAESEVAGRADGIDERGALRVVTGDGSVVRIRAGDVHVGGLSRRK